METQVINDWLVKFEKSIKFVGNKYIQANGIDMSIANINAGSILLILLS